MKLTKVFLIAVLALTFLYPSNIYAQRKNPMVEMIDSSEVLKTYVTDIKNSSGDDRIDLKELKMELENAFASRQPRKFDFSGETSREKFRIVKDAKEADIIVNTLILEYLWTKDDPVDMIIGVPAVTYDALTKENYARMQVVFSINDAKSGMLLWEDKIKATITDKTMEESESYGRINKRIVKVFMRELFKVPESDRQ